MVHKIFLIACLLLPVLMSTGAAEEGYGTVTFTVEVTGTHNTPTEKDGFRNIQKKRIFQGTAQLKHAGSGLAATPPKGFDRAAFEREKDACEQNSADENDIAACQDEVQQRQNAAERAAMQHGNPLTAAMQASRTDVWATESCSGEIEVADKGIYRRLNPYEGGMREVPTSLTARQHVAANAAGSEGCSFSLVYDPNSQTAEISIDPGPLRLEATERTNNSINKANINPFDWTAVRKFEKRGITVAGTRTDHSGAWNETAGEPIALAGRKRVSGEIVQTSTRVTWHFTGTPSRSMPQAKKIDQDNRSNADDPIATCLKEQERAGRAQPDPVQLMECLQKKPN